MKPRPGERWGFMDQSGAIGPGQSLVTVKRDEPHAWTLQLMAFRYTTGNLVGIFTGQSADNATVLEPLRCRMEFGVDGAAERVTFDYPHRGGSFAFHAQYMNLYLDAPTTALVARPPMVGAWVAPLARSQNYASPPVTLTTGNLQANALATIQWIDIPPRARAYRIVPISGDSININIIAFQMGPTGLIRGNDYGGTQSDRLVVSDTTPVEHLYPQRALWIPLDTDASGLRVINGSGVFAFQFRVQFLLDLG